MRKLNAARRLNLQTKGLETKWIGVILSVLAFVVWICILNSKPTGIYLYIEYLPLAYALINLLFILAYENVTIVSAIILAFEFLRFVVSPFIVMMEEYPRGLYTLYIDRGTMIVSEFIMIYEMIVIYMCLIKTRKYSSITVDSDYMRNHLNKKEYYSKMGVATLFVIAITVALFAAFPVLLSLYSFIFSGGLDLVTDTTASAMDQLPSGMGWLATTFALIAQFALLQYFVFRFYRKYTATNKIGYFYLSAIIILFNLMITSSSVVINMIISLSLLMELYFLYPTQRKKFVFFGATIGVVGVIVLVSSYLENVLTYQTVSQMIQDYTNGYYSVYQCACAYKAADLSWIDRIGMFFVGDGIANISPVDVFFDATNSSDIFNFYLYGTEFNGGAVVPFVSQSAYYLSPVIGPLLTAIPVYMARKTEYRWRNGRGNVLLLGFLSLLYALLPFMYNAPTFIHIITMILIPLWVGSKINRL